LEDDVDDERYNYWNQENVRKKTTTMPITSALPRMTDGANNTGEWRACSDDGKKMKISVSVLSGGRAFVSPCHLCEPHRNFISLPSSLLLLRSASRKKQKAKVPNFSFPGRRQSLIWGCS
jgi:hypothetical protein